MRNANRRDCMDGMPGADAVSEEEAKPFEVDLNFDEVPKEEAKMKKSNKKLTPLQKKKLLRRNQNQKLKCGRRTS